jgi:D-tyrosyl-tRNA(Tyr) deacylase
VTRASVTIADRVASEIGHGLLLLVAFRAEDDLATIDWMAEKLRGLRVFNDDKGRMNRSVEEVGGSLLVVSQFTLYGDSRRGRRPSYIDAATPDIAIPLYQSFVRALRQGICPVETGEFGAMMKVELVNDGPVTLIIDRD